MSENRSTPRVLRQRFKVVKFRNRAGSIAWRCYGVRRDGKVIRENFKDPEAARNRQLVLETEFHAADALGSSSIQATRLSDDAIAIAERAFARLDRPEDLLAAVDHWLRVGRHQHRPESPRLDEAFTQFEGYLDDPASGLRPLSARNLRTRCRMFVNGSDNLRVCDLTPQHIDGYLAKRSVSQVTRSNDRRAVSCFMSWCREQNWIAENPCQRPKRKRRAGDNGGSTPAILSVDEVRKLLRAAERSHNGDLVPYLAVAIFAGLRPFELRRLTWHQVLLQDGEIRVDGSISKTGTPRTIHIHPTLKRWLEPYQGRPFFPKNWRRQFAELVRTIGFGTPTDDEPRLRRWVPDILRHTCASHMFRLTGRYGEVAEALGNSESIIRRHYAGRVSSEDTKTFWAIAPSKRRGGK